VLVVNKVDDWRPQVLVADVVAEPGGIDNVQTDLEVFLLQDSTHDGDIYSLVGVGELVVSLISVVVLFQRRLEQRVDKRGLTQTGLTSHHQREGGTLIGHDFVPLVGQVSDSDWLRHFFGVERTVSTIPKIVCARLVVQAGVWCTRLWRSRGGRNGRSNGILL